DVQPAIELSGLDFRLTEQPTYSVRGRVIDPNSGQPPRNASVSITHRDSVINAGFFSSGSAYNPGDGTFEFRDVARGSYLVRAQVHFNGRLEPGQPPPAPLTATVPVDVAGDVDGVVLTFVPPTSIFGRVRIEGEALPQGFRPTVNLRPAVLSGFAGPWPSPPQINPEGTFASGRCRAGFESRELLPENAAQHFKVAGYFPYILHGFSRKKVASGRCCAGLESRELLPENAAQHFKVAGYFPKMLHGFSRKKAASGRYRAGL